MGWIGDIASFFGLRHNPQGRWYVYYIMHPRTEKVVYVGKGVNGRMYQHAEQTRRLLKRGVRGAMQMKCLDKWFIQLWDEGLDAKYAIVYRTDDEQDAYRHEARSIDHFGLPQLLNAIPGHRRYR